MNLKKTLPFIFIAVFMVCIPFSQANTISTEYSSQLQLNTEYTYNIQEFENQALYWFPLDYTSAMRATINGETGGKIIIKIVKFDAKESSDYSSSAFPSQIPYLDITFKDASGQTTTSLSSISNSEAGMNLALSYSGFLSGFIIPVADLSSLQASAEAQNTGFMAATVIVTNGIGTVTYSFEQTSGAQKSVMTYDIATGLLVSAEVDNTYGPDLKLSLEGYVAIPGIPLMALFMMVFGTVFILLVRIKKRM